MAYPTQKMIELPLLHLIEANGGIVRAKETYEPLADYFRLTAEDRSATLPKYPSTLRWQNRVQWIRQVLIDEGLLESAGHGLWKITAAGRRELDRHGLLGKAFPVEKPAREISHGPNETPPRTPTGGKKANLINHVAEIFREKAVRQFPDSFFPDHISQAAFRIVKVPPVILRLDKQMRDRVLAPGLPFHYDARNPAEATYIVYAHILGAREVRVPEDSYIMFCTVKAYEKHVRVLRGEILQRLADLTMNGIVAAELMVQVAEKLSLPAIE